MPCRCRAFRFVALCESSFWSWLLLLRSDAMRCDAMQSDAMQSDAMRCDAMRCDAVRCDAMRATGRALLLSSSLMMRATGRASFFSSFVVVVPSCLLCSRFRAGD